jgi:hypothetical protein
MSQSKHLDWSSKQGKILTCAGKATDYYTASRGFPYTDDELPHHYMMKGTDVFLNQCKIWYDSIYKGEIFSAWDASIVGCWNRPLFIGCDGMLCHV